MEDSLILTPDHPYFYHYLATPPPDSRLVAEKDGNAVNYVFREKGVFEAVGNADLDEYMDGGEYDYMMGLEEDS